MIHTARVVNESESEHVIACVGLAFKANVDDLRESLALEITKKITEIERAKVLVAEPHISELPKDLRGKCELMDAEKAVKAAGHVLIQTTRSVVSLGAEKMLVEFGKGSLIAKARSQPDKVKQVLEKVKTGGLMPTLEAVFN